MRREKRENEEELTREESNKKDKGGKRGGGTRYRGKYGGMVREEWKKLYRGYVIAFGKGKSELRTGIKE